MPKRIKKKIHRLIVVFLLAAFPFCAIGIYVLLHYKNELKQTSPQTIIQEQDYWSNRIGEVGGEKAYTELKYKYQKSQKINNGNHTIAHIFGESLYEREGFRSIKFCDNSFGLGCFHGFISAAIQDKGIESIPEINSACIQSEGSDETGCRHGIGHGLLEYLGRNELQNALNICSSIQTPSPLGCTQGVFMEYNRPRSRDFKSGFVGLRTLENPSEVHYPCTEITPEFMTSCYYEQSQWWVDIFHNDYKKAGQLCNELNAENLIQSCFMGIGTIAAVKENYNFEQIKNACELLPDMEGQTLCKSTAAWITKANPKFSSSYLEICRNRDQENEQLCQSNIIPPGEVIIKLN